MMRLNSRPWLASAVFTAIFIIVAAGSAVALPADPDTGQEWRVVPYATCTTWHATTLRWYPDSFTPVTLSYANDSSFRATGSYDHTLAVANITSGQGILVSGLDPGTLYHYALADAWSGSGDRIFRTFPTEGACSFIIYGDTREQAPYITQTGRHRIVADRIANEPGISFVINTGDLVSNAADNGEWDRFFAAARDLLGATTYVAVRGNHDADKPLFGALFGANGSYSFSCGDAHIAVLDSGTDAVPDYAGQAHWLNGDLASTERWKVVALHHPLFTSEANHFGGYTNLQKTFEPVFVAGNVSAVFNAHVHAYERVEHAGITYITEGRGGAPAYRLDERGMEGSQKRRENTLGYSRITTDPANGTMTIDVILVAEISPDLKKIVRTYPEGTFLERVVLVKPVPIKVQPEHAGFPEPFLNGFWFRNSSGSTGEWNRPFHLPFSWPCW